MVDSAASTCAAASKPAVNSTETSPEIEEAQLATAVVSTDLPVQAVADDEHEPTREMACSAAQPRAPLNPRSRAGFAHIYGWMGLPMVVIFLFSAAWTFMLAVIQELPEQTANYLMDTHDLDDGDFWLLPKPDDSISVPAVVLLVVFGIGYVLLVVLMLFPDKLMQKLWHGDGDSHAKAVVVPMKKQPWLPSVSFRTKAKTLGPIAGPEFAGQDEHTPVEAVTRASKSASFRAAAPMGFSWARIVYELTSPFGLLQHYYDPLLDLPKLIFQTSTLFTYLHHGFPVAVIFIYSSLLFVNWMISCYRYSRERPDPHYIVCRIFYSFDLFFAVFAPLEVLIYAYYTFHFDRDVFETRVAALVPGTFDRTARLFADPTQVSLFRIAFHYLQFTDVQSLFIKCALNFLSLFKWRRAIVHVVEHVRHGSDDADTAGLGSDERVRLAKVQRRKYLQNLVVAGTFFCAGSAFLVHSTVAVVSSTRVCEPYSQCKIPSYQWNVGATHCSCLVFVDRDTQLTSIDEWENPVDTSANLAALAKTGHLQIVQVINRQLPTLPDELRGCHALQQLILLYTKMRTFPQWAKEFTHLEYLHLEGDLTAKQLASLPHGLFDDMPHLMFIHLGSLTKIPFIPKLKKVSRLEYLTLAVLHSVTEIPSLENCKNLRKLTIVDAIQVYALPPTHQLRKLNTFALTARNPVCCNGFVFGTCDLTNFSCKDRTASGEPLVQCTTQRMAAEDFKLLTSTGVVCEKNLTLDVKNLKPTRMSVDVLCGGVMYKQCALNGVTGMCYPVRMQPIQCALSTGYMTMRRLQIERGVGDKCDPQVEGWLGCTA